MEKRREQGPYLACALSLCVLVAWVSLPPVLAAPEARRPTPRTAAGNGNSKSAKITRLRAELAHIPYRILYESYRGTNWELFSMNADGSDPVNLTRTRDVHEMYPHVSPDGARICFVADEGQGRSSIRSVYYMNADGTGRTLVARNARQPCWSPDGRTIAYTPAEYARFTTGGYASKGLAFYDVATGARRRHPNQILHHLYALCWTPDGRRLLATVQGGMGYRHANVAIDLAGIKSKVPPSVRRLSGCRPDFSPDGKRVVWNLTDQVIGVADLDLRSRRLEVRNIRKVVSCEKPYKVYHADWSPDGKYILFSHGPNGSQQVGEMARGWHIGIADAGERNVVVQLTTDGVSNKEADWVPAQREESE